MRILYALILCSLITVSIQCNPDGVSDTFLVLRNDMNEPIEVTCYGWPLKDDTIFVINAKKQMIVDAYQTMGQEDFCDFNWVLSHFDSLKVKTDSKESSKDFTSQSDWLFIKKHDTEAEYVLVIDQDDF